MLLRGLTWVFKLQDCLNLFQGEDERSIKPLKNLFNYSKYAGKMSEAIWNFQDEFVMFSQIFYESICV